MSDKPARFHLLTGERLSDDAVVVEPVSGAPVAPEASPSDDVPPVVADTDAVIPTPSGKKK